MVSPTSWPFSNLAPQQGRCSRWNVPIPNLARESYGRTQFTVEPFQPGSALA